MIRVESFFDITYRRGGRQRPELDCWGLYWRILGETLGLWLEEFSGLERNDRIVATAERQKAAGDWLPVAAGAEQEFDAVLMKGIVRSAGAALSLPMHIGCVLTPGEMIDIEGDAGVTVRPFRTTPAGRARPEVANRVVGIFRARALEARNA